jgi:glycosyltransferase involved in cell wall biosynthesis
LRLVIISHTEHFKNTEGNIVGWGPTIREINEISQYFEKIIHIAPLVSEKGRFYLNSHINYKSKNIFFVPLKQAGGEGLKNKLAILLSMPGNLLKIHKNIKQADWIQLRLPTNIGMFALPYLSWFTRIPRWVKYAGNWIEKNPPLSYGFQRWWLKNNLQHSIVTVNGKWPGSGTHIAAFENPCLNEEDEQLADEAVSRKFFDGKLVLLFVGRVEEEKGIFRVLDAILSLPGASEIFSKLIIVGDGKDQERVLEKMGSFPVNIEYTAGTAREDINKYYSEAHLFLLPSTASEGFPKVIAESARFGAIPVVSDVSSIGQYVNTSNGFVWETGGPTDFSSFFAKIPFKDADQLSEKSKAATEIGRLFTYRKYYEKLCEFVFKIPALADRSKLEN